MDRLKQVLARVQSLLATLTTTQRLLIGSLVVVMAMSLFLVALWTGGPSMAELLPAGTNPEDQAKAVSFLESRGIDHQVDQSGRVLVPVSARSVVLAQMGQEGALPADTTILFNNLASTTSWTMSAADKRQFEQIALQNELSKVISEFRGVRKASVIIDAPAASGLGMAVRQPTASATVFTEGGRALDQNTVDAVAHLIASARAGLTVENVRVIDGTNNRQHRARSDEAAEAGAYLEHSIKVEQVTRDRLLNLLAYIPGVVVAVNAQVDIRRTVTDQTRYLDPGKGTVTAPKREVTSEREQSGATPSAEPGVRSNVGADIVRGGATGSRLMDTQTESELETRFGSTVERVVDPRGMPVKVNATINIPRSYLVALFKAAAGDGQAAGGAAAGDPSDVDLDPLIRSETERIRRDVQPLVDASAGDGGATGEVVVSVVPDVERLAAGGAVIQAGAPGGIPLPASGLIKTTALGGLALAALVMMAMMVRKAGKSDPLPSAEELVGVPRTLQGGTDIVGEADEADSALAGIELTDDAMKSRKLMEQVGELVKQRPEDAAALIHRWVQSDD